jgi:hypothetical protein
MVGEGEAASATMDTSKVVLATVDLPAVRRRRRRRAHAVMGGGGRSSRTAVNGGGGRPSARCLALHHRADQHLVLSYVRSSPNGKMHTYGR